MQPLRDKDRQSSLISVRRKQFVALQHRDGNIQGVGLSFTIDLPMSICISEIPAWTCLPEHHTELDPSQPELVQQNNDYNNNGDDDDEKT